MTTTELPEDVVQPEHYRRRYKCPNCDEPIESIDIVEQSVECFDPVVALRLGQVLAYVLRHDKKGGKMDLQKAIWYLERQVEAMD